MTIRCTQTLAEKVATAKVSATVPDHFEAERLDRNLELQAKVLKPTTPVDSEAD